MLKRHWRRSIWLIVGDEKLARSASRLDWEKEVIIGFDFRAPVVTPAWSDNHQPLTG